MQTIIRDYLDQLEKDRKIKILLACETGSRAWGFPSPDSDYDVRIIYKHEKDWYLSLFDQKDTIQEMYDDNEIDITGWDVRKCLTLLMKSNPPLLERIQSHIIYKADDEFLRGFQELAQKAYSPKATAFHYFSMAKKLFLDVKGHESYKLKRFFYVLRSVVACVWIREKKQMPPIDFHIMLNELVLPEGLKPQIERLINLKAEKSESYLHSGEQDLIDFMDENITITGRIFKTFPHSKRNQQAFDDFFLKVLSQ